MSSADPPTELKITPQALATYRKMVLCEERCSCDRNFDHPCAHCRRWRELDSRLREELRLAPWQYPTVEFPPEEEPVPPRSPRPGAWSRFRQLEAALTKNRPSGHACQPDKASNGDPPGSA